MTQNYKKTELCNKTKNIYLQKIFTQESLYIINLKKLSFVAVMKD